MRYFEQIHLLTDKINAHFIPTKAIICAVNFKPQAILPKGQVQQILQEKLGLCGMEYIPFEFFTGSEQTTIKVAINRLHLWEHNLNWQPRQKQFDSQSLQDVVRPFLKEWKSEVKMVRKCVRHLMKQVPDSDLSKESSSDMDEEQQEAARENQM